MVTKDTFLTAYNNSKDLSIYDRRKAMNELFEMSLTYVQLCYLEYCAGKLEQYKGRLDKQILWYVDNVLKNQFQPLHEFDPLLTIRIKEVEKEDTCEALLNEFKSYLLDLEERQQKLLAKETPTSSYEAKLASTALSQEASEKSETAILKDKIDLTQEYVTILSNRNLNASQRFVQLSTKLTEPGTEECLGRQRDNWFTQCIRSLLAKIGIKGFQQVHNPASFWTPPLSRGVQLIVRTQEVLEEKMPSTQAKTSMFVS